jgi:2-methylisocitrate lyase-like PEP mutase family enzyme
VRTIVPHAHILVDIDDGYCDTEVACHVVRQLEGIGVSGVVLEDQRRPRRCGHLDGKQILELEEYLPKLERVLEARRDMFVVARTDASEPAESCGACARSSRPAPTACSPTASATSSSCARSAPRSTARSASTRSPAASRRPCSLSDLAELGVGVAIYSTPCLFSAADAVEGALKNLRSQDGRLPGPPAMSVKAVQRAAAAELEGSLRGDPQRKPDVEARALRARQRARVSVNCAAPSGRPSV